MSLFIGLVFMLQLHCCGFNNYTDYDQSSWRSMALNNGLQVPYTCCSTTPISLSRWSMATNHTHPYDGDDDDHNLFREASSTESFYISSSTESSSWVKRCQSVNPMESDDYLYVNVSTIYLHAHIFEQSIESIIHI